ncbi:hypothetical protein J4Q44_G00013040 [Coregonus suidteri]|uniref:Uncharacterized protein n=1 Tax=Coregonus suidteri TaxID=861788 RepID=A0AAN8NJY4_9TELE
MASALEQFVNNVRQLSAQGQMTQLCELINKSGELFGQEPVPPGHCTGGLGHPGTLPGCAGCAVCEVLNAKHP